MVQIVVCDTSLQSFKEFFIWNEYIVKKYLLIFIFIISLNTTSYASVLDIILAHTTIHIEPILGIDLNSDAMPLRVDSKAATVLTPGISLLYDNRVSNSDSGWSTTIHYHLNLNCYGSYMMGAGIARRYRTFLSQKISLDFVIGVEALVMTKKFLPTYNFGRNFLNLAYIIMQDLPGSHHKIIFPTPIVQCAINHKVGKDSILSIGVVWEGVAIVTCFGISIPITPYIEKLKNAHPPKRRYIRQG